MNIGINGINLNYKEVRATENSCWVCFIFLKSDSRIPKKIVLFASMKAL